MPDTGKQFLGVRTVQNPNLVEKMMNAAGVPYWKAIKFDGLPEVRNKMGFKNRGGMINNGKTDYRKSGMFYKGDK